jgi:cystathionine gamma-synthase
VAPRACYFAVRAWLAQFAARWGVAVDFVDTSDLAAVAAALRPGVTRLVWVEAIANPTLEVADLAGLARLAHGAGARLCVDATVATPVHLRALELGADLVMHSATKYLGGHSDLLAGALVTAREDDVWAELALLRREEGPCLGAVEAFLLLRGMRTLFARVPQQSATALALATRLAALPGVTVRYPGLAAHPQHALAAHQLRGGFGGLVALQTGGGAERALAVIQRLRVWVRATSLGGVESLAEHRATVEGPTSPTPADLIRLSCGLEHVDDLFTDLAEALQQP